MPSVVERFVERNASAPGTAPRSVRLEQAGEMQLKPGRWLPFVASHEASVERVEFSWRATFRLGPVVRVQVRDFYEHGDGGLVVRLWGLVPVMRGVGPAFAKGEAMRYLAELPWVPHAIRANDQLEWRELDAHTVEVATLLSSERAVVQLQFDAAGDVVASSAPARPRMEGKRTVERAFGSRFHDYAEIDGVRVPTAAEAFWELPEGRFPYFRARVTGVHID